MFDYIKSKAWPYEEARRIAQRNITDRKVVFQCGYGPSGLPHLGTFAEVQRTTWVRRAYEDLMGYQRDQNTRLIVFSDDMDALRRVPDNVPNQAEMERYVGYSLTRVPDPFGQHESFAHHNNAMLRRFLDRFDIEHEFMSSTEVYQSGRFDPTMSIMWDRYDAVMEVILPTMGSDRQATYSPFMPILSDGRVVMENVEPVRHEMGLVGFPLGGPCKYQDIYQGRAKCQWKADWALRWYALEVDYEMAGKDLIDSVTLSSKIVKLLGGRPPVNMIYEMFLDEDGHKIAKSKGNGLSFDQWLRYGTPESLAAYLFRDPKAAKKLYPAIVPLAMDEFYDARNRYEGQRPDQRLGNAVHHVLHGDVPLGAPVVTYQLLLNIASTAAVDSAETLLRYVTNYFPIRDGTLEDDLDLMASRAFNYYRDHLAGKLQRRPATPLEARAIAELATRIEALQPIDDAFAITQEQVQFEVYEVGKQHYSKETLREWFRALYEVLMGQSSGPRFGAFAVLYGIDNTVALLKSVEEEA